MDVSEAEYEFCDDVLLHFVRATGDRHRAVVEVVRQRHDALVGADPLGLRPGAQALLSPAGEKKPRLGPELLSCQDTTSKTPAITGNREESVFLGK